MHRATMEFSLPPPSKVFHVLLKGSGRNKFEVSSNVPSGAVFMYKSTFYIDCVNLFGQTGCTRDIDKTTLI